MRMELVDRFLAHAVFAAVFTNRNQFGGGRCFHQQRWIDQSRIEETRIFYDWISNPRLSMIVINRRPSAR